MSKSSQVYLLNEHGELYFLLQISDHYIVRNNQGSFKKILGQFLFVGNHHNKTQVSDLSMINSAQIGYRLQSETHMGFGAMQNFPYCSKRPRCYENLSFGIEFN